jgi:hypothetical protein
MFTPRELAELSIMLELRNLGVPLATSHAVAEKAAPGLLLTALQSHAEALAVQGPPDMRAEYLAKLEKQTDGGYLATLADIADLREMFRFALVMRGECDLLHSVNDDMMDGEKGANLLNLFAMVTALVETAQPPPFTLITPPIFQAN